MTIDLGQIAAAANRVGVESRRRGAPLLSPSSDVQTLASWLQWCDPNGCHLPELAAAEDFEPYMIDAAWSAVAEMCEMTRSDERGA